jgi:hypothetical protein
VADPNGVVHNSTTRPRRSWLVMTARSTASRAGGRGLRPLGYELTGDSFTSLCTSLECGGHD